MEIFGRAPASYRRAARRIFQLGRQVVRATHLFREPWRYLAAYTFELRLAPTVVEFRDGLQIALSRHRRDVATVFVVFIRRDYGHVPAGATVVDIGANIGCFSLYAAREGARRVFAFEPCQESFDRLRENVRRNGRAGTIVPFQLAVTNGATAVVRFPTRSDPANRIARDDFAEADAVPTTTIDAIVTRHVGGDVDLMKIDCEGAEYDLVAATSAATWQHVAALRIEYHHGRASELIDALERCGFALTFHAPRRVGENEHGDLWFDRVMVGGVASRERATPCAALVTTS
jgi:FkbM family methyltransferase